jgi:hypothetical protein
MVDGKIRALIHCILKFYNFPGEKISLPEILKAPEEKIVTKLQNYKNVEQLCFNNFH